MRIRTHATIRLLWASAWLAAASCVAGSERTATSDADAADPHPYTGVSGSGSGDPLAGSVGAGSPGDGGDPNASDIPFTPDGPDTYINKIKIRLTGLPATDAELRAGADSSTLATLVDSWLASEGGRATLLDFFSAAFQQKFLGIGIMDYLNAGHGPGPLLQQELQESWPRTVLDWVERDQPFNAVFATKTYSVTTRVLSYMLQAEVVNTDDRGRLRDLFAQTLPNYRMTLRMNGPPTDIKTAFDINNPNFMSLYAPTRTGPAACSSASSATITPANTRNLLSNDIGAQLGGGATSYNDPSLTGPTEFCKGGAGPSLYISDDDNVWRQVTFTQSVDANRVTPFYDLPSLRKATTVQTRSEKVGFLTSVPFMAQWMSNSGNEARGITNQALVVALGRTFDGTDITPPASTVALDTLHSDPTTTCYACHRAMDPMRQYFRQAYSHSFHLQTDPNESAKLGTWVNDGVSATGPNLTDFANRLAAHPGVALAWSKKLCDYLNSTQCMATDPELVRVSEVFRSSGYNFRTMFKAMLLSPLTTNAQSTLTARRSGVVVSAARQRLLCKVLSARLDVPDICSLDVTTSNGYNLPTAKAAAAALPDDAYSRGSATPLYISNPTAITRAASENLCALVATSVVDVNTGSKFTSTNVPTAIASMVRDLMGVPTQSQAAYSEILQQHYTDAVAQGSSATTALRSAFVIACLSPQVAAHGL